MKRLILMLAFSLITVSAAKADGDAAKGEKVFRMCSACHTADAGMTSAGPVLLSPNSSDAGARE